MKQSDWQHAFGQPDQAFHRAFTETLEQLEEMNMKRRYRISTLLAAAVLLTLAFAGAALATGGLLGHVLLPGFRPLSLLLFLAACQVLGLGFSKLDRRICKGGRQSGPHLLDDSLSSSKKA